MRNITVVIKSNFDNMPRPSKAREISEILKRPFLDVITDMYVKDKMCTLEIEEELEKITGIFITGRSVQRLLKRNGIIRSRSEAYNLSIAKGRKSYEHLKKKTKSKERRKGIMPKLRYAIMKRDDFSCVLCGRNSKDDGARLVLDHIVPVVSGGTNVNSNLRTLCSECNTGKMLLEEKYL